MIIKPQPYKILRKKPLELNALIKSLVELGNLTNANIPTINTIFALSKYFAVENNCYVEISVIKIPKLIHLFLDLTPN